MAIRAPMALKAGIRNDLNDRFGHALTYRDKVPMTVRAGTLVSFETRTTLDLIPKT